MRVPVVLLVLSSVLAFADTGTADEIFDTIGDGDVSSAFWVIGRTTVGIQRRYAARFSVEDSFFIESVEALVGGTSSSSARLTFAIQQEENGAPDGTVLESVTNFGLPFIIGNETPEEFTFSGSTLLEGGQDYFLVATASTGPSDPVGWRTNTVGFNGTLAVSDDAGPWQTFSTGNYPAFRINGSVVPEPNSFSLLAVMCIWHWQRRRDSGARK